MPRAWLEWPNGSGSRNRPARENSRPARGRRKGRRREMVTVIVQVKVHHGDIFGVKEDISSRLEEFGEVHVISASDEITVEERIEAFIARN